MRVVGICLECGKGRVFYDRKHSERFCENCGVVNGRVRPLYAWNVDDQTVILTMKVVFREMSQDLVSGKKFLTAVQQRLGKHIPAFIWYQKKDRWLEGAGLRLVDKYVMRR